MLVTTKRVKGTDMFVTGISPGILFFAFNFLLVKCSAQEERIVSTSEDYFETETPLQCFYCNSEYDPRCGDPFNSISLAIVNCLKRSPPDYLMNLGHNSTSRLTPTACTKIVEKEENRTRVIRDCGFIQEDRDSKQCLVRTGPKNDDVTYCACTHPLCNASINIRPSLFSVIATLFSSFYLSFRY